MTTTTRKPGYTCPVCTGPAHPCDNGNIYCGDADMTMTPQQVAKALTAHDIAAGIKAGTPIREAFGRAFHAAHEGEETPR